MLDRVLEDVRAGRSGALVIRGEPGVGKTALLEYAIDSAADLRVARAVGVESEMELCFAALHQLCAPMLCIGRASTGSSARASAWSSPAPTCYTASGCDASGGRWTRASSCARPARRSRAWEQRPSRHAPSESCWPLASVRANASSR